MEDSNFGYVKKYGQDPSVSGITVIKHEIFDKQTGREIKALTQYEVVSTKSVVREIAKKN
ncbi:hypothetical protein LC593_10875 [Nostoc sp. CHAB 5844]|nr:hypothetical protein [Nostoc sp. CHAB 5844]